MFYFLTSCSQPANYRDSVNLGDIIYTNKEQDATFYLQENDAYVPYIAIADDYRGGVLVLRKYLLDTPLYFNNTKAHGSKGGYYPGSNIDHYLSDSFFQQLSHSIQDAILQTHVEVATLRSVSTGGGINSTENISRKVFLLSATEMNIRSWMACKEGSGLRYFMDYQNYIACSSNGTPDAYWLRSSYLWDDIQAWSIGADGEYGGSSVSLPLCVRPAFCLDGETLLKFSSELIQGKTVYYIE